MALKVVTELQNIFHNLLVHYTDTWFHFCGEFLKSYKREQIVVISSLTSGKNMRLSHIKAGNS